MDILSKLPGLKPETATVEEIDEAQAKKDRIAYHRDHVRNGPVKHRSITSGQERRARQRRLERQTRKARKAQVRLYLAQQREAATLRGHLQAAGVQAYAGEHVATGEQALRSIVWIVRHYADDSAVDENGRVEVTHEVVVGALTAALNRWQTLAGMPVTPLSPAYVLPVSLSA